MLIHNGDKECLQQSVYTNADANFELQSLFGASFHI